MKFILTLAATLAISTSAYAAPTAKSTYTPSAADVAFANKAGNAAAAAARAYHREYARMYRVDPIGMIIGESKMVNRKPAPKPAQLARTTVRKSSRAFELAFAAYKVR